MRSTRNCTSRWKVGRTVPQSTSCLDSSRGVGSTVSPARPLSSVASRSGSRQQPRVSRLDVPAGLQPTADPGMQREHDKSCLGLADQRARGQVGAAAVARPAVRMPAEMVQVGRPQSVLLGAVAAASRVASRHSCRTGQAPSHDAGCPGGCSAVRVTAILVVGIRFVEQLCQGGVERRRPNPRASSHRPRNPAGRRDRQSSASGQDGTRSRRVLRPRARRARLPTGWPHPASGAAAARGRRGSRRSPQQARRWLEPAVRSPRAPPPTASTWPSPG